MKIAVTIAVLAVMVLGAWVLLAGQAPPAKAQSFEQRYPDLPKDAVARRSRSNAVMVAQGVPVNSWLPVIESEAEAKKRPARQITMRAIATLAVALKGEGLEQGPVDGIVRDYHLATVLTPDEKAFIAAAAPSERDRVKFSWRYEAANVLLWSLGFVDSLGPPRTAVDPAVLVRLLKENSAEQLVAKARLRPIGDILDQADLIYRYRWALVDARINGKPAPAGLNDDVAMERHHALNWLIGSMDQDWDDISLDT